MVVERERLVETLCIEEERTVGRDNTIAWEGRRLQIPESPLRRHYVNARVKVHAYPDGTLAIVDYKTGGYPSKNDLKNGAAPQLPLEALILAGGGALDAAADWFVSYNALLTACEACSNSSIADLMAAASAPFADSRAFSIALLSGPMSDSFSLPSCSLISFSGKRPWVSAMTATRCTVSVTTRSGVFEEPIAPPHGASSHPPMTHRSKPLFV